MNLAGLRQWFLCVEFSNHLGLPGTPAVKRYCIITFCLPCGKFDWSLNTKRTGFWSWCVSGAYFLIYYLDKKKMVCDCKERHIASSSSTIPVLSTLRVTQYMQLSVDKHAPLGERTVCVCFPITLPHGQPHAIFGSFICVQFWRVDAVMQGVYHGLKTVPHDYTVHNDILISPEWCWWCHLSCDTSQAKLVTKWYMHKN